MAKSKEDSKVKKILIKVYLLILFVVGIVLGFSYQAAKDKQVINFEQMLDNNIVTALTSNGIEQGDVVSQFIKEVRVNSRLCHEYHKKIALPKKKKADSFEPIFKTVARNFKIELVKRTYRDKSCVYSFEDKKRMYSKIEFVK